MDLASTVKLNNGVEMPWLGLGVFQSEPGRATEQAVRWALEIGYRHIDTAAFYNNEGDVGKAVRESGIPRESVFVTTKVWNTDQGYESTLRAFDRSRRKLDMDTVDLFLIHWPVKGKYLETWRALEKLHTDGKVRAIGVSNFLVHHLQDVVKGGSVPPAVNQVEFHPFLVQKDILAFDARMKIQPEAWAPLTRTRSFDNPLIVSLSRKYGKTPAQIILRWDLQVGVVTIPKSVHRERIEENSRVFDFALEQADVDALSALDTGTRIGPNPDTIDF